MMSQIRRSNILVNARVLTLQVVFSGGKNKTNEDLFDGVTSAAFPCCVMCHGKLDPKLFDDKTAQIKAKKKKKKRLQTMVIPFRFFEIIFDVRGGYEKKYINEMLGEEKYG